MSIHDAVGTVIREHPDLVEATRQRVPKAWGRLAALGVVAFRRIAGRAPTDDERRAIWAGLWAATGSDPGPMR